MSDGVQKKVEAQQEKLHPNQQQLPVGQAGANVQNPAAPRTPNAVDEQFPTAGLQAKDARDKVMAAKLALGGSGAQLGKTPFGKMVLSDEDLKWVQRKAEAVEKANFQQWFARNFDFMSPAQKKVARQLYPEFYAERQKLLNQQARNLQDYARIKLHGVQSKQDLLKQYAAETGRLDIGPLNHLLNPLQGRPAGMGAAFKRGLLNPFRVFGDEVEPAGLNTRKVERNAFARRTYDDTGVKLGLERGFPPFNVDQSGQGDRAWLDYLAS